jgi:peptidoglycan/LPS O-acetylase OafA/YrhL
MRPLSLPSIRWQDRSQLSEDTIHSLLISLLRGMAALQVAVAHLRAEVFPSLRAVADPPLYYQALAFATGFAHQAVVVFFLISGWLVGGSLLNKMGQPQAVRSYAIDRLTRLWTVLVPALLLMVLVGALTGSINPGKADFATPGNEYSVLSYFGNLFGLQTVFVENFGRNYALWSLANETWYYVQFPLLLLVLTGRGMLLRAGNAAALVLIAVLLPWAITLYFTIWLLGAAFSRIRIDCGNGLRIFLVIVTGCLSVYFRLTGSNDDLVTDSFVQDLICSLPFLALLSATQIKLDTGSAMLRIVGKVARFFSDFSFTLYVIHVPSIAFLRYVGRTVFGRDRLDLNTPLDYAIYAGMASLLVAIAYLSYRLFESQTFRVRRKLKELFLQPTPKEVRIPAMSAD